MGRHSSILLSLVLCGCGSVATQADAGDSDANPGIDAAGDSCAASPCDPDATCDDSSGEVVCTCNSGFSGDGTLCTDDNECDEGTDNCDPVATCGNTAGSFTCTCPEGYEDVNGDGTLCTIPFSIAPFPITIPTATGGWANLAFDAQGNLLVPSQVGPELYSIARVGGARTTLAPDVGAQIMSVVYDPTRDLIFVGANAGPIYTVVPATGEANLLVNVGATKNVNGLAMAPSGFGAYGGWLLAAIGENNVNTGALLAINPESPSVPVPIVSGQGWLADIEFSSSGVLYAAVAQSDVQAIATITAAGVLAPLPSTPVNTPGGLAIDEVNNRIYVAEEGIDQLSWIPIAGGTPTPIATYDFDSGYYPSGMLFDGFGTLIMPTGGDTTSTFVIQARTVP